MTSLLSRLKALTMIPKEMTEAGAKAAYEWEYGPEAPPWESLSYSEQSSYRPMVEAALTAALSSQWRGKPLETAPKDGKPVLFLGRWKPYDILPGGEPCYALATWGTVRSDGAGHEWRLSGPLGSTVDSDAYNVEWLYWSQPLPPPPTTQE